MRTPKICGTDHLATVLDLFHSEIVGEWRLHTSKLLREHQLDTASITSSVPDIVAEVVRDLAVARDGVIPPGHSRGSAPVHGVNRFFDGISIAELIKEYNVLRAAFITVAERHELYVVGETWRILSYYIGEAEATSINAFLEQQSVTRKEQEDDHLAFVTHDLLTPLNAVSLLVTELTESLDRKTLQDSSELIVSLDRSISSLEHLVKRIVESQSTLSPTRPTTVEPESPATHPAAFPSTSIPVLVGLNG